MTTNQIGEMIEITYSYWDGHGHRRSITVSKGTRVDQFLEKARRYLIISIPSIAMLCYAMQVDLMNGDVG
jgi:hypothetical protein